MVREKKGFLPQNQGENEQKHTLDSAESFKQENTEGLQEQQIEASKVAEIDFKVKKLDKIILHMDGINQIAARSVNDLYEFVRGERSVYASADEAYSAMKQIEETIFKDAFVILRDETKKLIPLFEELVNKANMPEMTKGVYENRVLAIKSYVNQSERDMRFDVDGNLEMAVDHLRNQLMVLKDEITQLGTYEESKKVWDKQAEEQKELKQAQEQKNKIPNLEAKDWVPLNIEMPFLEKDISVLQKRYTALPNFLKTSLLQEAYKNLQDNPESSTALENFNAELLDAEISEYRELQNQKQIVGTLEPNSPAYNNYLVSIQELEGSTLTESDVEKYVPSREDLLKLAQEVEANHTVGEKLALDSLLNSIRNTNNPADESQRVIWLKQLLLHKQGIEFYLSVEAFNEKDTSEHAYAPTSDELPEVQTVDGELTAERASEFFDDEPTAERKSEFLEEENLGIDADATTVLAPKKKNYLEVHADAEPDADTEVLPYKNEPKVIDSTYQYELDKQAPKYDELQNQAQELLGSDGRSAEIINQWVKRIDDIFVTIESAKNQGDELAARQELQNLLNEYNQELQGYRQEKGLAAAGQEVLKQARQAHQRLMELDPGSMTIKELENAKKKYVRISILAGEINALAQKGTSSEIQLQKREKYEEFRQAQQEFDALFEVKQNDIEQKPKQEVKSWMDDKIEAAREEIDEIKKDFSSLGPLAQAGIQGLEKIYSLLVNDKKSEKIFNHSLGKFNKIAEQTRWGLQRSLEVATFESVLDNRFGVFGTERARRIDVLLDQYKSNVDKYSKEGQTEEEARVFQDLQKRLGIVMESSVLMEAQALEDRLLTLTGEAQDNQVINLFKEHAGEWRTLNPFNPDPQSLILKLEEYKTLKQEAESSVTALEEAAKEKRLALEAKNNEAVGEVLKEASDEEIDAAMDEGFADATSESRMAELREKLRSESAPEEFVEGLSLFESDLENVEDLIENSESMNRFVENIDALSRMNATISDSVTLYNSLEPGQQWKAYAEGNLENLKQEFEHQLEAANTFVSSTGPELLKFIERKYKEVDGKKEKFGTAQVLQEQWENVLNNMMRSYDLRLALHKSIVQMQLDQIAYENKIQSPEMQEQFDFDKRLEEGKQIILDAHNNISGKERKSDEVYQTMYDIENKLYLKFEEPAQNNIDIMKRKKEVLSHDPTFKNLENLTDKVKDDIEMALRGMKPHEYAVFKKRRDNGYADVNKDKMRAKPFIGEGLQMYLTLQGTGNHKIKLDKEIERIFGEDGLFNKASGRRGKNKAEREFYKDMNVFAKSRVEANFYAGIQAAVARWYYQEFLRDEENQNDQELKFGYLRGNKNANNQLLVAGSHIRSEAHKIFTEILGDDYERSATEDEIASTFDGDLSQYTSLNEDLLHQQIKRAMFEAAQNTKVKGFKDKAESQRQEDARRARQQYERRTGRKIDLKRDSDSNNQVQA